MKRIEHLLREVIGLDANSIGSGAIHRAVRLRMKVRGLREVDDYLGYLSKSPIERTELIESVVVTETWFFRDPESFCALVRLVKEEWLPEHPAGILRILSVPCSSGEEPYSLVMALLEAGLPPPLYARPASPAALKRSPALKRIGQRRTIVVGLGPTLTGSPARLPRGLSGDCTPRTRERPLSAR